MKTLPPVAPSRGRGLKRGPQPHAGRVVRRPFTGAWIETHATASRSPQTGRPFTGAWIETWAQPKHDDASRRPFTGAWIETGSFFGHRLAIKSPLHGGVD